jgi:hypothetical protein
MRRRDFVAFVGALVACPFSARARQQERSLNVSGFEEAKRQFDKISQIWQSAKKTGGRKEGTPNKRTAKMRDATRRVLEDAQLRGRMDDLDVHGFMVLGIATAICRLNCEYRLRPRQRVSSARHCKRGYRDWSVD